MREVELLDQKMGIHYADDDIVFYRTLLVMFIDQTEEKKKQMIHALNTAAEDDGKQIIRLTHSLKGETKALGAYMLSEVCAEMEDVVKARQWELARTLWDNVLKEWDLVLEYIKQEVIQ